MLPPHELKNKQFPKALKGYSQVDVDEHIDFIIEKYTEIYRQNDELERKLETAQAQVEKYQKDEESIRSALINAQRASSKIIDEANERAESLLRSTKTNCDIVLAQFRDQIIKEKHTLDRLCAIIKEFKARIFEQYSSHIEYLEQISPDVDISSVEIPDEEYTKQVLSRIKIDLSSGIKTAPAQESTPVQQTCTSVPESASAASDEPRHTESKKAESSHISEPRHEMAESNMPDKDEAAIKNVKNDKNEDTIEFTDEEFAVARDMFRNMSGNAAKNIKLQPVEIITESESDVTEDNDDEDVSKEESVSDTVAALSKRFSTEKNIVSKNLSIKDSIMKLNMKIAKNDDANTDESDDIQDDEAEEDDMTITEQADSEYKDFIKNVAIPKKNIKPQDSSDSGTHRLTDDEQFDAVYNPKK